jgi:hypothetical protein
MSAQDGGDFCGGSAAPLGGVGPAVSERPRAQDLVGVVPVGIAPAAFFRVRREPVEFDADAVLIQVVQVPGPAAEPALGLAPRGGQAMSAFDAVDVVAF